MAGLSLDCLTLLDVEPAELVRIAGTTGYEAVSLWVQAPILAPGVVAVPAMERALRSAMTHCGVRVGNLEVFNLGARYPMEAFRPALEFGARLGAISATAIDYGDSDPHEIHDRLAAFCALAGEHALRVNVEPISMGRTRTLHEASELIRGAGVSDAGIVIDCAHFIRMGGTERDLAGTVSSLIRYVQLCDGADALEQAQWGFEATEERLYPGEGRFPLVELLAALPREVQLAVEVPSRRRREAGITGVERARELMAATRRVLALAGRNVDPAS